MSSRSQKMSSDFVAFEDPLNSSAMLNSEALLLSDSSIDSIQAQSLHELAQTLISYSSPSDQLQSLSLFQQAQFPNLQSSPSFEVGFIDCPVFGVKLEEAPFRLGFDSLPSSNAYFSGSEGYVGDTSMVGLLERSYNHGNHSYDGRKQGTLFQPQFGVLSEPFENCLSDDQFESHLIRVFSTGDLPKKTSQRVCSSLLGSQSRTTTTTTTSTLTEEASFKVGKYGPEERKEKINRYRAKRGLRNFNKTIKYACRKTLADNRPRVRGRFARNDEPVEMAISASGLNRYEHEDDLWVGGLNKGIIQGGSEDQGRRFASHFGGSSQFDHEFIGY